MTIRQEDGFTWEVGDSAPDDWEQLLSATGAVDYSQTEHWQNVFCRHRTGANQIWIAARRGQDLVAGMAAIITDQGRRVGGILSLHRIDSSVDGVSGGPLLHPSLAPAEQDAVFAQMIKRFLAERPSGLSSAGIALNANCDQRFENLMKADEGWHRRPSPTAMVSLVGGSEMVARERLVGNKRNERNRGLRRGAEVFATSDPNLLAQYYPIYTDATSHWGVAPLPLGLLQDLLSDPDDRVFFTCVRLEGQVIGGHLCLHLGDVVFAWNGVTDPEFARTHFPATLCFWGDIVEACERGARWLDFGASGGVNSLSGFKKYFGAELMERGFYTNDSSNMKLLRRTSSMLNRLRPQSDGRWHDGATGAPRRGHGS